MTLGQVSAGKRSLASRVFFPPKRKNSNAAKEAFLLMLKPNRRLQIYFTSEQKSVKPLHRTTGPRFQTWVFKYPPPTHNNLDCVKSIKSKTKNIQQCLCMAERTGCPFLTSLWSYVTVNGLSEYLQDTQNGSTEVQNQNGGLDYKQEKYK